MKHHVLAITDEIYEHIILNDQPHVSIASLPGMAERTVTISGLSKTFSVTGWRLGYCIAPDEITNGIRRVHDFLTVGAPHPLQMAGVAALHLPETYYLKLRDDYRRRGSILLPYLHEAGFKFIDPDGAYYVMTDITPSAPMTTQNSSNGWFRNSASPACRAAASIRRKKKAERKYGLCSRKKMKPCTRPVSGCLN